MPKHTRRTPSGISCDNLLKGAAGELGYLIEHGKRLDRLSRIVRELLPPALGQHCRLANVSQQSLVMHADSPVWASRLRYYCPQLLADLCQRADFGQLSDVRIKTVPPEYLQVTGQPPGRRLSGTAAGQLRTAARLTPYMPLRNALLRLARRGSE